MKKLLFIFFVLCTIKNGVANPLNDSINSYLDRNLRYPSLCKENSISGNIILAIDKKDTSINYQFYRQDKYEIFKSEVLRVIKNKDFKNLLPSEKKTVLNIEFNINMVNIDNSTYDTLLVDSVGLERIFKLDNLIHYSFNLGEREKRLSDSAMSLYNTYPEKIWKANATDYSFNSEGFISEKNFNNSKIIVRYSYYTGYSTECIRKGIQKPCSSFNELSISNDNLAKAIRYETFGNDLEIKKQTIIRKQDTRDSLTIILNKLRCLPNQIKHINTIFDGWSCTIEIFYDKKKRTYHYSNPNSYAKDGYTLDKEFMVLLNYINSFFK
ncbi:MAG: hypothetical protein KA174_07300 [Chitinophagales bacterium]|nr:hypothetical protein [Chitinophagales bacterium]